MLGTLADRIGDLLSDGPIDPLDEAENKNPDPGP
jgi:hypothetical protein